MITAPWDLALDENESTERGHGDGNEADRLADEHRDSMVALDDVSEIVRGNLPESFWSARPVFRHIRQAAHSRARSADAVLGCVLARVAAMTPPAYNLPAIAGAYAPLSTYVAVVGPPGAGKSSAKSVAVELIRCDLDEVADDLPLGSGEGLIEAFFDLSEDTSSGKVRMVKRQTRYGLFLFLDEGQILSELGARKGSTLMPMLRTAWSGSTLGTTNASIETRRKLPAGSYSLGLVIAFQPSMAADLLGDSAGGTPQRFAWLSATDPKIPDIQPAWPGPLSWQPPAVKSYNGAVFTATLTVAPSVVAEVHHAALQRTRGVVQVDELDAHADLARLKVAGLFAILENRVDVTEEDWLLAGLFQRTSRAVRTVIVQTLAIDERRREESGVRKVIRRDAALVDDQASRALVKMARSIGRHVHNTNDATRRTASRSTASRDRQFATVDEAIDHAVSLHWIRVDGDHLTPGDARPQ